MPLRVETIITVIILALSMVKVNIKGIIAGNANSI